MKLTGRETFPQENTTDKVHEPFEMRPIYIIRLAFQISA